MSNDELRLPNWTHFAVGGVFLGWGDPVHEGHDAAKSGEWRAGFRHLTLALSPVEAERE